MSNLQEAFREAARREFTMVPTENEIDYAFSPGFQRKMRIIIRAQVHGYWQFVNTAAKRVACIAAIIAMLLTTVMAIKPIRDRVIEFFVEVYEEYFSITFGEEESGDLSSPPETITKYTLSWLPENYVEEHSFESDFLLTTIWRKGNNGSITFYQGTGINEITLNHADKDIIQFPYGALSIFQTYHLGTHELVWEQNGYVFHLITSEDVSLDDALRMIDSLTEKGKEIK